MKSDTNIYISLERNVLVDRPSVTVADVAGVLCADKQLQRRVRQLTVIHMDQLCVSTAVVSSLKIMETIQQELGDVSIQNIGETDVIVQLQQKKENKSLQYVKVAFVCFVLFFGAAFTIMSFHTDVGLQDMFQRLYVQLTGEAGGSFTVLEVCYSIGIFVGVVTFFNHIGKKKITPDPTPIQVQMREYEKTVDSTFVENAGRGGSKIDVE